MLARNVWLGIIAALAVSVQGAEPPVFDIPKLDKITVDGNADDWAANGFRVDAMMDMMGKAQPASEFDARFRLGWDERGLLVLIFVHDSTPFESSTEDRLSDQDSVELLVADKVGGKERAQILAAPGRMPGQKGFRQRFNNWQKNDKPGQATNKVVVACTVASADYVLEVLMPWENLKIKPELGREVAVQINVKDGLGSEGRVSHPWYPKMKRSGDTTLMHRVRLAEKPGPAVELAASGTYERFRRTRIGVITAATLAGKSVEVHEGDRLLGSGKLEVEKERSVLKLILPMPPRDKPYGPLQIQVDGKTLTTVDLPNPEDARLKAYATAEFNFTPFVFTGDMFPPCDFQQPTYVEDLIGLYTINKVTFYDAKYNVVTVPSKPGRYGAIVEIRTEDGQVRKKFKTLYRTIKKISWDDIKSAFMVELPPELGIDATIASEQTATLGTYFRDRMREDFDRSPDGAILLAGLSETTPGNGPTRERNNARARDNEWWHQLKKQTGDWMPLKYLTFLATNYEQDPGKRWPLVLFLHGSGERGNNLAQVKNTGLPKTIDGGKDFPFITIAPQCPPGDWWNVMSLRDLLDEVCVKYRVDPDRVYLTGLSMGGFGTWSLATQFPERFAAIVPICGGGDPEDAARIKDIPAWVFHGAKDPIVPSQRSQKMVDALKKLNVPVRFTLYPEAEHDSWTQAYATEELYTWLLQQRRNQSAKSP